MLIVACRELTVDQQLALAAAISDSLEGAALALVRRDEIVLDVTGPRSIGLEDVRPVVEEFVWKQKDSGNYSLEVDGETIVVHSADPVAAARKRVMGLPPNVRQCPFCGFVTPYDEVYMVHVRAHGFVM